MKEENSKKEVGRKAQGERGVKGKEVGREWKED